MSKRDWNNFFRAEELEKWMENQPHDWAYLLRMGDGDPEKFCEELAFVLNSQIKTELAKAKRVFWYKTFDGWYDKEIEKTHKLSLGDEKPTHTATLIDEKELK